MVDALRDRGRLHGAANEALDQNLAPDEAVNVIITGPSNQAIIGTDRRAFVFKKGFMAGATFLSEFNSWDYRSLVGVQIYTRMFTGAVVLQVPGQPTQVMSARRHGGDSYKASHAIPIERPWGPAMDGVARLRQLVAEARPQGSPGTPRSSAAAGSADPMALLKQLGELRDAGVLTPLEFDTKKAEILSRI